MADSNTRMADAINAGNDRDACIIDVVSECKISLNAATRIYAEVAKSLGVTRATGKARALEMMDLDGTSDAPGLANTLVATAKDMDMAESTIRGYAKDAYEDAGWDWPLAGRASDGILNWLVDNHECTKKQFEAFMATAAQDGGKRSQSNINEYWKGMELHRRITAALATDTSE
jgi:hypothetical protein